MKFIISLILLVILNHHSLCAQIKSGFNFFQESKLHTIKIITSDTQFIQKAIDLGDIDSSILASIEIDGVKIDSVGFKERGNATTDLKKPSLKVDFNYWKKGGKYDGLKAFILRNCVYDPSYLREFIAYKLLRNSAGNGLRTTYAIVYLNSQYLGLYLAVEHINSDYCNERFGNGKGDLFKTIDGGLFYDSISHNYSLPFHLAYEQKTNTTDFSKLEEMLKAMKYRGSINNMRDTLNKYWNYHQYVHYLATNHLINLHDYWWHNYYMYHNKSLDKKWNFIAWDQDLSIISSCNIKNIDSSFINNSLMHNGIFYFPEYQKLYYKSVSNILYQNFQPKKIFPLLDSIFTKIKPWALADTFKTSHYDLANKTYSIDSAYQSNYLYTGIRPYIEDNFTCTNDFLFDIGFNYKLNRILIPGNKLSMQKTDFPFYPKIQITNDEFYVSDSTRCAISILLGNDSIYQDTILVSDLFADSSNMYSFNKPFNANKYGKYHIQCSLINIIDKHSFDNTVVDSFILDSISKVYIKNLRIDSCINVQDKSTYFLGSSIINPTFKISLRDTKNLSNQSFHLVFYKNRQVQKNKIATTNLIADSSVYLTFKDTFYIDTLGKHSFVIYTNNPVDSIAADDTLKVEFNSIYKQEIQVDHYIKSFSSDTLKSNQKIVIGATVSNFANPVACNLIFQILDSTKLVQEKIKAFVLNTNESKNLISDSILLPNKNEKYKVKIYHDCLDQNHQNDTITSTFWVSLSLPSILHAIYHSSENIHLFPNPFHDKINIQSSTNDTIMNCTIMDMAGKIVLEINRENNNSINLNELAPALYQCIFRSSYGIKTVMIQKL